MPEVITPSPSKKVEMSNDTLKSSPSKTKHMNKESISPMKRVKIDESNIKEDPNLSPMKLLVKRIHDQAKLPTKATPFAAGYDLCSVVSVTIQPKDKALIDTGLQIAIPTGYYGRIAPRSGLTHKHFIDVGAGVIDADYRGNLGIILFNFGSNPFEINPGDRIAQLIIEKIGEPEVIDVQDSELPLTNRGADGFGSTGTN